LGGDYLSWAVISRDGQFVATSGWNYDTREHRFAMSEVATGKMLGAINVKDGPAANVAHIGASALAHVIGPAQFSRDAKLFATRGQGVALDLWAVTSGEHLARLEGRPPQAAKRIVSQARDIWILTAERHRSLAFSPDGKRVAVSGVDGKYCVWDLKTRTHFPRDGQATRRMYCLTASRAGNRLAWFEDDALMVGTWDGRRTPLHQCGEMGRLVSPMTLSFDGRFLAGQLDASLLVCDLVKDAVVLRLALPSWLGRVSTPTFSPDGATLAFFRGASALPLGPADGQSENRRSG
jgi:WD40 repeat protein